MPGAIVLSQVAGQPCDISRILFYGCPMAGPDCCGQPATSPIATPTQTTGGVGSAPAPTVIPGAPSLAPSHSCSSCRPAAAQAATPTGGTIAAPTPSQKAAAKCWWCYVLAAMILAGVVQRERA